MDRTIIAIEATRQREGELSVMISLQAPRRKRRS